MSKDLYLDIPGNPNPRPKEVPLEQIRDILGDCKRCMLFEGRNNIVFGSGNKDARVVIVGEAPGKNEDLQGEPFVGKAGQNLSQLLEIANLKREDIYITNVLKCRPPSNRNPQVPEIDTCAPFLREQIRSIWPDVIVTLGNFATRFILKTDSGITSLRGTVFKSGHFKVLPMFHPAAAIYDPQKLKILEDDFKLLAQILKESE